MKKRTSDVLGGDSITPPTYTKVGLKSSIDWFTCTFDHIKYSFKNNNYSIEKESEYDLQLLIKILTGDKPWYSYNLEYGYNGYKDCLTIGEFIKINFYGPKNKYGNRTTMILLSGQACREFLGRGGSFINLIKLMIQWSANCTRFDLAIDDHEGDVCDIYDLWKNYIEPCYYTSPFHSHNPHMPMNNRTQTYQGFGIYFGTKPNQLLIYDKKLERENAGESVFDYKKWYRYELRFAGGKANTIMNKFLLNLLDSKESFSKFAMESLYDILDVKTPNLNDSNKNRWKTAPMWKKFLNEVEKLKIVNEYRPEPTIERKEEWLETSVDKTLLKLYFSKKNFIQERMKGMAFKVDDFKDSDLEEINKYLKKHGKEKITRKDLFEFKNNVLLED